MEDSMKIKDLSDAQLESSIKKYMKLSKSDEDNEKSLRVYNALKKEKKNRSSRKSPSKILNEESLNKKNFIKYKDLLLSPKGAINRSELIRGFLYIAFVQLILMLGFFVIKTKLMPSLETETIELIPALLAIPSVIFLMIKRLRDIGTNPMFLLLLFVPVINVFFWFYLLFKKTKDT